MLGVVIVLLTACAGRCEPTPTRVWTPDDHGQPQAPPADQASPEPAEPAPAESAASAEARAARALWLAACASCHGREGRGDGPSPPPGARVPDLTLAATLAGKSGEQLAAVIRDGRGMMPAFGKQIVPAGVEVLVRHVRALATPGANEGAAPAAPVAPTAPSAPSAPKQGAR